MAQLVALNKTEVNVEINSVNMSSKGPLLCQRSKLGRMSLFVLEYRLFSKVIGPS